MKEMIVEALEKADDKQIRLIWKFVKALLKL